MCFAILRFSFACGLRSDMLDSIVSIRSSHASFVAFEPKVRPLSSCRFPGRPVLSFEPFYDSLAEFFLDCFCISPFFSRSRRSWSFSRRGGTGASFSADGGTMKSLSSRSMRFAEMLLEFTSLILTSSSSSSRSSIVSSRAPKYRFLYL